MALARLITFTPLTLIKSADVNGEFNNILNNPVSLLSPTTGPINFNLQLHTNLLPSAITASSANTGQAIIATSTGGTVFGNPTNDGYMVGGLVGNNNAGTPNSKYDLTADQVILRNPTTGIALVKTNTGAITNDTGLAGSAANGRDQAGAFGASSWIHFYFIAKDDGTLATLSSAVAPPTGPTLPATYTSWAYAGAVFFTAGSILTKTRMRGSWMYYEGFQTVLNGGVATVETSVSLANFIPPNALKWQGSVWNTGITLSAGGAGDALHVLRYITGVALVEIRSSWVGLSAGASMYSLTQGFQMPNQAQNFFYLSAVTTGSAPSLSVDIHGYQVPNGGE